MVTEPMVSEFSNPLLVKAVEDPPDNATPAVLDTSLAVTVNDLVVISALNVGCVRE
jgi:hypothetical protein